MRAGDVPVRAEFLSEAEVAALLRRRQAAYARVEEQDTRETRLVLRWWLGAEPYASPLEDVRAVATLPSVTRVPGAPAQLAGVVSRGGVILNLFDPAPMLGAKTEPAGAAARMLVLRRERPLIAIRVSTVAGVEPVDAAQATLDGLTRFVSGPDGVGFTLVSTPLLVERLIARRGGAEG